MLDIFARELKGHNILAVERFQNDTRYMIEFKIRKRKNPYGAQDEELRLFLTQEDFAEALKSQQRQEIKIRRVAYVIEGHILDDDPKKYRRDCNVFAQRNL